MWHSKFMSWVEQKLIDLTSTIYIKRRENVQVEQIAPTFAPATEPTKKRTFVKRTEPKITKASVAVKKTRTAPKAAKPAVKKPAAKKPAVKAKPAAIKAKTKAKAK